MKLANGQLAQQGLAEIAPLISTGYYYPEHLGLQLERQYALYGEIYERQPWVRSVIDKRAAALARLPVNAWWMNGNKKELDNQSGYGSLLQDPCTYLSPFDFWTWVWTTVDIYGETFLVIQKNDKGLPESLLPMHPSRVAIKRDSKTSKYTYYFQAGSGVNTSLVNFSQDEVVPFRLFNPKGMERGLSRMQSLKDTLFSEDSSRNATSAMWKNAGRPNIVLQHQKHLSPVAQQRLKEQFDQAHAGSSNSGKTLLLEEGMTIQSVQLTAVEMQHIESRKLNREEITGVYDTAPPAVHILDHATFSNITEQLRGFYRDTMSVPIAFVESVMDKWVGSYWYRKNKMEFDINDVVRGDFEARAQSVQHAVTSGTMTPNEGREVLGLVRSDDPKADELYANSALQPLGMPAEQIRLEGQINGATPDGVGVTPVPVATLDQSKPTTVPALPVGNSDKPTAQPAAKPKHLRAIKSEVGRGRSTDELRNFAKKLAEKYPNDLDDILLAVRLAVSERNQKAK